MVAKPDYKEHYMQYTAYLQWDVAESNVTCICNMEATAENIKSMAPDVVIVATGAEPIVPPIQGANEAVLADDVLTGNKTSET